MPHYIPASFQYGCGSQLVSTIPLQEPGRWAPPAWVTNDINVVKECKKLLGCSQPTLDRFQSTVLPKRKEEGHHCIALLSSFALWDVVSCAVVILPATEIRRTS